MGWLGIVIMLLLDGKCRIKADSQSDARHCVTLICEIHKFFTKKRRGGGGFLTTRCKNAMQRNAWIGSESILASCYISTSINAKTMQSNALFKLASYCEPALIVCCYIIPIRWTAPFPPKENLCLQVSDP